MILTLTIRSQVSATSSEISLHIQRGRSRTSSNPRVADTLSLIYQISVFIQALDTEALRALIVKFARYQPLRGSLESNVCDLAYLVAKRKPECYRDFERADENESNLFPNEPKRERRTTRPRVRSCSSGTNWLQPTGRIGD